MTKDEALEMAIEMLEKLSYEYGQLLDGDQDYGLLPSEINADIIKTYYVKRTCQEALEQPAQEPVAWMDSEGRFRLDFKTEIVRSISAVNKEIPLYTHPAPQPAQEPVAWNEEEFNAIAYAYRTCPAHEIKMVSDRYQELVNYVLSITHPAPSWQGNKEFVGLSDDEKLAIIRKWKDAHTMREQELIGLGDAFEQELKTKNGFSGLKDKNT